MTNETIIKTGINVRACVFFDDYGDECRCPSSYCGKHRIISNGLTKYEKCRDNFNCYFKQSARKDELIEELKEKITKILETELQELDIDWDGYEVSCRETDYSTIIITCEEALEIINGAKNG